MNKCTLSDWCEFVHGYTLFRMNTVIHSNLYEEEEIDGGNNEIWSNISTVSSLMKEHCNIFRLETIFWGWVARGWHRAEGMHTTGRVCHKWGSISWHTRLGTPRLGAVGAYEWTTSFVFVAISNKSGFLLCSRSRQGEVYPTAAVWQSKTTCFLLFIETVTLSSVSPSDTLNKSDFQKSSMLWFRNYDRREIWKHLRSARCWTA